MEREGSALAPWPEGTTETGRLSVNPVRRSDELRQASTIDEKGHGSKALGRLPLEEPDLVAQGAT